MESSLKDLLDSDASALELLEEITSNAEILISEDQFLKIIDEMKPGYFAVIRFNSEINLFGQPPTVHCDVASYLKDEAGIVDVREKETKIVPKNAKVAFGIREEFTIIVKDFNTSKHPEIKEILERSLSGESYKRKLDFVCRAASKESF